MGICVYLEAASVRGVAAGERQERRVLFRTRRASVEMRAHAGNALVRRCTGELEIDIDVDQLEAFLAEQLGSRRAEDAPDPLVVFIRGHVFVLVPSSRLRLRLEWGKNPRGKMGRTSGLDEPDELVQVDPAIGEFARQLALETGVQEPLATPRGD